MAPPTGAGPRTADRSLATEKGHAGQSFGWGNELFDTIEETDELRWPNSVQVYEKMRRTSGKVGQSLKAITLPIRKTAHFIDPNGAKDEIVARLSDNLGLPVRGEKAPEQVGRRRQRGRFSWKEHQRLFLLSLVYGFMPFNQVYEEESDGFFRIKKLAPRFPHTITSIKVADDGGLISIMQLPRGITAMGVTGATGQGIEIKVNELLWYSLEKEGANWTGMSILRQAYMHWLLQHRLYRVDAMTKERNGMGVPGLRRTIPQAPTPAEEAAALAMAKQFRAGEYAGWVAPYGYDLEIKGVSGTLPDTLASAQHHGEEIPASMLAQFVNLGHTETGSRALGDTFSEQLYLATTAVNDDLLDVFNEHQIEDWVDINWGEDELAPLVVAEEISEAVTAEQIRALVECGALKPDKSLRSFVRRTNRLPQEDEENEDKEPTGQTYQYDLDYQIVTIDERRAQIGLDPLPGGAGAVPPVPLELADGQDLAAVNAHRKRIGLGPVTASTLKTWEEPRKLKPFRQQHVKAAAEPRTYRRELFEHEIRATTDFTAIDGQWKSALERIVTDWKDVRTQQIDELVGQISDLVDAGDVDALGELGVTASGSEQLESILHEVADEAADAALAEAKRQGASFSKPDLSDATDALSKRAVAVDGLLGKAISEAAGRKALQVTGPALTGADVAQLVRTHLEGLTDSFLEEQLGGAITAAQNSGRTTVMAAGEPDQVYSSELLDDATCDNCADVDGREYGSVEAATQDYPTGGFTECLGGSRCRGTLVSVYPES